MASIHLTSSGARQEVQEDAVAIRLFGMIPGTQGIELLTLWREFEQRVFAEARPAKALDRVQPLLINVRAGRETWTENDVTLEPVLERYASTIQRRAAVLRGR